MEAGAEHSGLVQNVHVGAFVDQNPEQEDFFFRKYGFLNLISGPAINLISGPAIYQKSGTLKMNFFRENMDFFLNLNSGPFIYQKPSRTLKMKF